ncbi:unnamed protein product [Cuscuta epithymum]|uniref:F-box domain-containing protein n=1 Tax=Cuscuta epithymum TaxID=186058 RepID=A0AAV0D8A6_9ASTE|nr:unnamed protein product [Cuscuta epithymum]
MKRAEMYGGIPYLPEEILRNILKRLPVKSLVRFRCVSRLWKNHINAPSFIIDHLSYSNHQTPSLITDFEGTSNLHSLDLDMELRGVLDGHPTGSIRPDRILGCCHGLLCVQTSQLEVVPLTLSMWNPAIRGVMPVPRSRTQSRVIDYKVGFGFSPSLDGYKIVIIYTGSDHVSLVVRGVEVYSLATNSWKDIEFDILDRRCLIKESLNVNGSIFWLATNLLEFEEDEGWRINTPLALVSFDIASEEFKLMPTPPLFEGVAKLAVYEKRLALLHSTFDPNSSNSVIDLWVIEEGIGVSWSKKFTFGPYPYYLQPLTICRNQIIGAVSYFEKVQCLEEEEEGVIKVKKAKTDDIYLINLTSNEFKVIAGSRYGDTGRCFEYVESLLSPSNIQFGNA